MSALIKLGPLVRVGGRLFRGGGVWATGSGGVRHAGGGVHIQPRYRQRPQLTSSQVFQGEFFSALTWFWIFWRLWHEPEAVMGHFTYPDPSQWTDEELGILPDEED
ncbi:NADH dehydrogenase [ubiquinone] 1 beta subcomplex subunit 2, mitochondrial [Thomomys bottae]